MVQLAFFLTSINKNGICSVFGIVLATILLLNTLHFSFGRPNPSISSNPPSTQQLFSQPYHTVPGDLTCHNKSHQLTEPCMEKFTLRSADQPFPVWNKENCCKLPATAVCIKAKLENIPECTPLLMTILGTFLEQFNAHCPSVTCRI